MSVAIETNSEQSLNIALATWLAAHAHDPNGVEIITLGGQKFVVKRRGPKPFDGLIYAFRFMRSFTLSLLCWLVWGQRPATRTLLQNGLTEEARRLQLLRAAGCHVPKILHQEPGVLVLEFVGEDLPHYLRTSDPAGRIVWIKRVASDLASFHLAGFVHGGAHLRNLMFDDNKLTRIDFEENIGEALALPLGQAYDFYQMLSSLAGMRADEISASERQALCNQMLHEYLLQNPEVAVKQHLKNMAMVFTWLVRIVGPILRLIPGKDVQGFLYVTNTLGLTLTDE